MAPTFKKQELLAWQTHSAVMHGGDKQPDVFVSADKAAIYGVRVSVQGTQAGFSVNLNQAAARALAAELIAAADSLQAVAEAA